MRLPNNQPDAIVLACWPGDDPLFERMKLDPALMPMGDKPMLQRVVERLAALGCREIGVVLGDQPQHARRLLGDGERWGCNIRYSYASAGRRPLEVLTRWLPAKEETCLIAPAESVVGSDPGTAAACAICWENAGNIRWTGWARLARTQLADLVVGAENRTALERRILGASTLRRVWEDAPISTAGSAQALESVRRLFAVSPGMLGIMRRPASASVWLGNGSSVHAGARLVAPVYIGNHAKIKEGASVGPNAIIGDNCVIDCGTAVKSSLVMPGTYVGRDLELDGVIVSEDCLANVRHQTVISVVDRQFFGGLDAARTGAIRTPVLQRLLALLIWPLSWLAFRALQSRSDLGKKAPPQELGVFDPATGAFRAAAVRLLADNVAVSEGHPNAWRNHFLHTFHPGLRDVVAGRVALVGMQPRTIAEIIALPHYWRRLYTTAQAGLINEALLLGREGAPNAMRHAGDALSAVPQGLLQIMRQLIRYAGRVPVDNSTAYENSSFDATLRGAATKVSTTHIPLQK